MKTTVRIEERNNAYIMKYNYLVPPNSIGEYVNSILVIEDFEIVNPFTLPLFANGCPTLIFQTKKVLVNKELSGHFTLFGQTIKPGALTIHENFTLIAYFFKPHSLMSLFNVAGNELSDTHVDLNLLKQSDSGALQEKLLNCQSADDMVLLLNQYVLSRINKKKTDTSKIGFAIDLIRNNSASNSLKPIQNTLCVTEKTLQRMYEKNIGISPRMYKRVCQFNAAFQQLNFRNFLKFSDIAYQNDYADQSHFIRAFKEFTNLTPKEYLRFGSTR